LVSLKVLGDLLMKKHLIAAAVAAAVAVPAMAQVSIYGQLDVSYGTTKVAPAVDKVDTVKTTALADDARDSSRIGFRGTEDLGSGLKAGFVYEVNLDMVRGAVFDKQGASASDTASGDTQTVADGNTGVGVFSSTRQAFASLTGGFGDVKVGYKKTLETDFNDAFMIGTENSAGHQAHVFGRLTRANGIYYTSPSFNGVTGSVQYTTGKVSGNETGATDEDNWKINMLQVGVDYNAGPLRVGAVYGSGKLRTGDTIGAEDSFDNLLGAIPANAFTAATLTLDDVTDLDAKYSLQGLGATYNFGVARVAGLVASRKVSDGGDEFYKNSYYSVSVAVPVGNVTLTGAMSRAKETVDASADVETDGLQLMASYAFSKRTDVYALWGQNKIDRSDIGEFLPVLADDKVKTSTMRIGIAHRF
jgi:predicted porin